MPAVSTSACWKCCQELCQEFRLEPHSQFRMMLILNGLSGLPLPLRQSLEKAAIPSLTMKEKGKCGTQRRDTIPIVPSAKASSYFPDQRSALDFSEANPIGPCSGRLLRQSQGHQAVSETRKSRDCEKSRPHARDGSGFSFQQKAAKTRVGIPLDRACPF